MNKTVKRLLRVVLSWLVYRYKQTTVELARIEVARKVLTTVEALRRISLGLVFGLVGIGVMSAGFVMIVVGVVHCLAARLALGWTLPQVVLASGLVCFVIPAAAVFFVCRSALWMRAVREVPGIGTLIREAVDDAGRGRIQ